MKEDIRGSQLKTETIFSIEDVRTCTKYQITNTDFKTRLFKGTFVHVTQKWKLSLISELECWWSNLETQRSHL